MTEKVAKKTGRNDPCLCGSGKKQKKCCGARFDADGFLAEAGKLSPKGVFRHVDGWELQLSFADLGHVKEVFYLSAMLHPAMRASTEKDWHRLGQLLSELGAPLAPVMAWEEFHPNAPHHFAWDKDGRVEIAEQTKESLRKMQLQRFGDLQKIDARVHCKLCEKFHVGPEADVLIRGHILREHPESLSDETIDKLASDERAMVAIHKEAAVSPELWKKLLERVAARIARKQAE